MLSDHFCQQGLLAACAAEEIYCESGIIGPYFPDFSLKRTTIRLKIEKICPRLSPHRISDGRIQRVVVRKSADSRWIATRFMKRRGLVPLVAPAGPEKVQKQAKLEDLVVIRGKFVEGARKLERIPGLSDATRHRGLALLDAARTPESSRLIPSNEFGLGLVLLFVTAWSAFGLHPEGGYARPGSRLSRCSSVLQGPDARPRERHSGHGRRTGRD